MRCGGAWTLKSTRLAWLVAEASLQTFGGAVAAPTRACQQCDVSGAGGPPTLSGLPGVSCWSAETLMKMSLEFDFLRAPLKMPDGSVAAVRCASRQLSID